LIARYDVVAADFAHIAECVRGFALSEEMKAMPKAERTRRAISPPRCALSAKG
jgi:hypothetical protein